MDALAIFLAPTGTSNSPVGVTKTNTYHSAAYALSGLGNQARNPLWAHFWYDSVANASGTAVITFTVDWSDDGSTWTSTASTITNLLAQSDAILLTSTTAVYGQAFVPIYTKHPYIRANILFSTTTGTPTGRFWGIYDWQGPVNG